MIFKIVMKLLSVLLLALFLIGCAAGKPLSPPEERKSALEKASPAELAKQINEATQEVDTLEGNITVNFLTQGLPKSRQCEAKLYFQRNPTMLRIDGYEKEPGPLFEQPAKYFTVLARNGKFWVDIPVSQKLYSGKLDLLEEIDKYEIAIQPSDTLKALLTGKLPEESGAVLIEEEGNFRVLSIYDQSAVGPYLSRKIWLDGKDLPRKEVYYSPQGFAELEIKKDDYIKKDKINFPRYIQLLRLRTGEMTSFYFKSLKINPKFDESLFSPVMPGNPEVVEVGKDE